MAGGEHRFLGVVMLLGALALTAAAAVVVFWPDDSPDSPAPSATIPPTQAPGIATVETAVPPTPLPTIPPTPTIPPVDWTHPTADPVEIAAALDGPVTGDAAASRAVGRILDPLTISPLRSRDSVITYAVQQGDNLDSIAAKFGLEQSTIIWSNARFYVNAMRVGLELNILPVNGVYHHVVEPQTIAAVAADYAVDPYTIIDSEFNTLFGATPGTILPSGLYVVVPGGTGTTEPVYWDPGIVMTQGSSASGAAASMASFGDGQDGSCGRQAVQGGSPPYSPPLHRSYLITQEFSWEHGGIDLAVPVGTGVFAAGGGTVIFAGWSDWGYGYTVVIAHGSTLSLYGHLNGPLVRCGQVVSAGQGIAVTGTSGRSSGPHLHFEIRGSDGRPTNPRDYQGF